MMEEPDRPPGKPPELKIGDRGWFWLASEPSSFELMLADCLTNFPPEDRKQAENGVYYVSIHSWRGDGSFTSTTVSSFFPMSCEMPNTRFVSFMHVEGEHRFEVPDVNIIHTNEGKTTHIRVAAREIFVGNQIVFLAAARQIDYDMEAPSLAGISDSIGLLSIMCGCLIQSEEIVSGYFCRVHRKFISGKLKVTTDPTISRTALRFTEPGVSFDAKDERTHGALWFAGRAFSAKDHASKIVFYRTALELIGGKQFKNFFGRVYSKHQSTKSLADEKLKVIEKLRGEVVHEGKRANLPLELERYVQALILDGLRFKHGMLVQDLAVQALRDIEQSESGEGKSE